MAYKHILVAVDTTEEADEVLTAAQALADQVGATLSALSVVRPLAGVYGGLDMVPISQGTASFEQEAVDQAKAKLTSLGSVHGISPDNVHVKLGPPAAEIRGAADTMDVDLIVIGTHGRHGLGLLLGSTANAVLHGVRCDVLAVKIHPQA
ncbi:MAG: universal stress protein [Pseudomonadales bacterium]